MARRQSTALEAAVRSQLRGPPSAGQAEPRTSTAYSPHGGYAVTPADKMVPARAKHRKRKRNKRTQVFIDPEGLVVREGFDAMFEFVVSSRGHTMPQPVGTLAHGRCRSSMGPPLGGGGCGVSSETTLQNVVRQEVLVNAVVPQGLQYTVQTVGSSHGLGTSPSAATAPDGPGRFLNVVDGPEIKRTRRPRKRHRKPSVAKMVRGVSPRS